MNPNKENIEITDSKLSTKNVSELVNLVTEGVISGKIAKTVLEETWDSGLSPIEIVESSGLKQIDDDDEIERIIDQIINKKIIDHLKNRTKIIKKSISFE